MTGSSDFLKSRQSEPRSPSATNELNLHFVFELQMKLYCMTLAKEACLISFSDLSIMSFLFLGHNPYNLYLYLT